MRSLNISNLIFVWYFALTLLAVFSAINTKLSDLAYGLGLMWLVFLSYYFGGKISSPLKPNRWSISNRDRCPLLGLVTLIPIICSLYAAYFYTGKDPVSVVQTFLSNASLYNQYQIYFSDRGIGVFSANKIGAIASLFFMKISLIFVYARVLVLDSRHLKRDWLYLLLVSLAYFYFSVARGTSFELFEIFILISVCFFLKAKTGQKTETIFSYKNILLIILCVIFIAIYNYNLSARYSFEALPECRVTGLCYSENTILAQLSPSMGFISAKLSGYFTFGIFYASQLIEKFWLIDEDNFILLLMPVSWISYPEINPGHICDRIIECGVSWSPSIESYIYYLGFVLLFPFFAVCGWLTKMLSRQFRINHGFIEVGMLYFLILLMVSLPVGNFISNSSSNLLSFSILFAIWINRQLEVARLFKRSVNDAS